MANSGRAFEQIDEMTVFDVRMIFDYWSKNPPANEVLVAVYSPAESNRKNPDPDDPSGIGDLVKDGVAARKAADEGASVKMNNAV